ncbi:MAG: SDR family NAD(P)-dependent oxidoreductase [Allosphingosinicella sp.]|uniref:SDR family NAD(P)-dependent oxidoreductase n=1 Tax=Allosphingosinicella sp. TaxID=2823234 RepID=UPI0039411842
MKQLVAVTGASGALGSAVARHLAEAGYSVAAIDLTQGGAAQIAGVTAIGGVDLADPDAAVQAFAKLEARGGLHGLVNVAGGFAWETLAEGGIETWDAMYRINLRTAVNACKAALPMLSRGSAIVSIGALGSIAPGVGMAAYAASKSGVARLTESLAEELKGRGIRVNAVLPSIIDTPTNRRDMPDADFATWVAPEALARVIAFLLGDAAAPITGALLPVAGPVT